MVDFTLRGVWLADVPLDVNDTSREGEWVLALDVSDEHEIVEEGKGYREWCIPAEKLTPLPIAVSAHRDDEVFAKVIAARWTVEEEPP